MLRVLHKTDEAAGPEMPVSAAQIHPVESEGPAVHNEISEALHSIHENLDPEDGSLHKRRKNHGDSATGPRFRHLQIGELLE